MRRLLFLSLLGLLLTARAQMVVIPPAAIDQLQKVIGDHVELGTILGGDYAAAGGIYTFRGGSVADLNLTRIGGGGDIASPRSLGIGEMSWAPVLQGNLGRLQAGNEFSQGYLQGNRSNYDTRAALFGFGARFYFTPGISLAPVFSGIYAHTENEFLPATPLGQVIKDVGSGTIVDWQVDTWSVVPGLDFRFDWTWGRTAFEFRSRYNFYHTESFESPSPFVAVNGDSQTWENKLDADIPLGWHLLGCELHTGGFFSRTELFGGAAEGLNTSSFYTVNGRLVLDPNGKLWKLRWFGFGASYFWGNQFQGWSAGIDLSLKF
jgi:hypothetical protein